MAIAAGFIGYKTAVIRTPERGYAALMEGMAASRQGVRRALMMRGIAESAPPECLRTPPGLRRAFIPPVIPGIANPAARCEPRGLFI